ncbi:hypothetical protein GII30_16085 [Gordonia amarae]|uniref:NfeD-like C-terminal domain-containing protein n=2 Tax=Gordonia amarae TaxID=36821 RepID=G7GVD5_9ACTN|nr:NfeD family protein [Gordonia amarae]GAB07560.1 hypothetical protein GOAMR_69_00790 [Gordonia amarae NBRC 15530]QHN18332.1 hypothetical protein GII35_16400 [Gordonia amarae]QHN22814.1 hypothetical protein GII34_15940 [Gordonia amarae]QHN31718.1 hypothetical protein GII32_16250 [Gordonia amarae]QHN40463.1 hypothetical protein GII30_16085 [Gordonia amarae]
MTVVFGVIFAVGLLALLAALFAGEIGEIGEIGDDGGLPFMSLTTLAIGLFGFGAGGLGADFVGLPTGVSIGVGAGAAVVLVGIFRGLLLPYMLRQQSNSHFGRASYLGMTGRVELPIAPDGWGEITIVDPDGARVRLKARSEEPSTLAAGTQVYICDLDAEYVRVVAIPALD